MKLLTQYLAVAGAGALGAMARLFVATVSGRFFSAEFPLGTLIINVTGSLFLGWFLAAIGPRFNVSDTIRMAIAVGFVGAYTTFSTFMYESDALLRQGAWWKASTNIVGSLVLGLLAVRLGAYLASR